MLAPLALQSFRTRLVHGAAGVATAAALLAGATPAQAADPSIRVNAPAAGDITGKVVFSAQPANATPSDVDFLIDGVKKWDESRAPFRFNDDDGFLDTSSLSVGRHTLSVKGYFSGRTVTSSVSVNVVRPAAVPAPSVRIAAPAAGTVSAKVPFTAVAANGTPTSVDFLIDGVKKWSESAAPFEFNGTGGQLDPATLSVGPHTLSVKAYFSGGRTASAQTAITVARPAAPAPSPAPAPAPSVPTQPGSVLWGSTFENGDTSIYRTVRKEGSGTRGSHSVTTERARTGSKALKITLPSSTSGGTIGRYQLVAGLPNGKAGEDRWYGASMYFANDWNLAQVNNARDFFLASLMGFRYTQTSANGPGNNISGTLKNGVLGFSSSTNLGGTVVGGANTEIGPIRGNPFVKGRWIDFVEHVKWSKTGDGIREIWMNGVKLGRYTGPTIGLDSQFEHRIGYYQGTQVNHTRTLYIDNHRVGTSYTAVDPSR